MRLLRTALAGTLLLSANFVHAQTADEIISKHVAAIGGSGVIESIRSQVVNSNLSVMGSELSSISTLLVGKGFKNVANFNGQEIIQCITPTGGWMINPLQGMSDPQPLPEDQVKAAQSALSLGGELYNYQQKGSKAETAGRETVEGVNAYKLKLTNKEGMDSYYWFDPTTYYVIKREMTNEANGQTMTATSVFSNFKKTDIGYVMPFTTVSNQGFEMTINIVDVKFNVEIDPKTFEMPK